MGYPDMIRQTILVHHEVWRDEHFQRIADQIIEEMAELTKDLCHAARGRRAEGLMEEMADVEVCLEILKNAFGINSTDTYKKARFNALITRKALRLKERLENMTERPPRGEPGKQENTE
jgi:phosphoribosyl-ATP pyrophosphohydrolase